jgi:hypothetical protein
MSGIHLALLGMNFGPGETTVEYLVIAGGGGGGNAFGGGGGAGGYRTNFTGGSGGGASPESSFTATFGTAYTVTTGAGGEKMAVVAGAV